MARHPKLAAGVRKDGGVDGTHTAALEYVKQGIRVNAVNRGLLDTQIARDVVSGNEQAYAEIANKAPIGRAGPGASYVIGHGLTVDGGMTVA